MTDRVRMLTVFLKQDMRDDDVEHVVNAIRMLAPVEYVTTHVVDGMEHCARETARLELRRQVYDALFDREKGVLKVL